MNAATILYDDKVTEGLDVTVDGDHLWLAASALPAATGWKLETEGLCRGDACVRTDARWVDGAGRVDLAAFTHHLGQPMVRDDAAKAWAFGESVNARRDALFSLEAPDFCLPDIDGKLHKLSDYRGRKVFMYSWGSY